MSDELVLRAMVEAATSFRIDGLEVYQRDDQVGDVWEVRDALNPPVYWTTREVALQLVRERAGLER